MGNSCSNGTAASPSTKTSDSCSKPSYHKRVEVEPEYNHEKCVETIGMDSPALYTDEVLGSVQVHICTDPQCKAIYRIMSKPSTSDSIDASQTSDSSTASTSSLSSQRSMKNLPTICEEIHFPIDSTQVIVNPSYIET